MVKLMDNHFDFIHGCVGSETHDCEENKNPAHHISNEGKIEG